MTKGKVVFVAASAVIIFVIISGFFLFGRESENRSTTEAAQETGTSLNLGITYLPVTPRLSAYYDLGVDSGALVTEIIPNSLAAKAGVEVGDVILSFNGVGLEKGVPLLGAMRACAAGNTMVLEVWRGKNAKMVELVHAER